MPKQPMGESPMTNRPLRIRLTDADRDILDAAAARKGQATATWARDVLMRASKNVRKNKKKELPCR